MESPSVQQSRKAALAAGMTDEEWRETIITGCVYFKMGKARIVLENFGIKFVMVEPSSTT